jgi:hypothetical protein
VAVTNPINDWICLKKRVEEFVRIIAKSNLAISPILDYFTRKNRKGITMAEKISKTKTKRLSKSARLHIRRMKQVERNDAMIINAK